MKKYSEKEYEEHLKQEHSVSISGYLREIVYGGSDGIVTTFAVVAGFTGAQSGALSQYPVLIVLVLGLANLFADAFSMGASDILSTLAEKDVYRTYKEKELHEIKHHKEDEKRETIFILQKNGFSEEQAKEITDLYSQNDEYWAEFMMKYELEMQTPEHKNPIITGLTTMASFIFFGFIPLIPYVLTDGENKFLLSIVFALAALILLGTLRWKLTIQTWWRSVGEIVLLGGIAAAIAYFVGTLFS